MKIESPTKQSSLRFRELIVPILLLVYGFSHLYHIGHLRVRCAGGTFLRNFMETIQGLMVLMRTLGPYIVLLPIAIWVMKTGFYRKLNATMLAIVLCCCVISVPYAYRLFQVFVH